MSLSGCQTRFLPPAHTSTTETRVMYFVIWYNLWHVTHAANHIKNLPNQCSRLLQPVRSDLKARVRKLGEVYHDTVPIHW